MLPNLCWFDLASKALPYEASQFTAALTGTPSDLSRIFSHTAFFAPPPLVMTRLRGGAPSSASLA
jgi:hypothetical protein